MRIILLALALAGCGLESAPQGENPAASAAAPVSLETLASHIVAIGPDWRFDSDPQAGLTLDLPQAGQTISADYAAPARTDDGAMRIASGRLTLTLIAETCRSSEVAYPMRALVEAEGETPREGCAYARWDDRLAELLPAIDACLSLQPAGAAARYAAEEAAGRVLVRLTQGDMRLDCRAPRDPSAGPAVTTPAQGALPGEGDPIFVRAPGQQPGGECYAAPEVRGPDGALLGWLATDEPC